MRKLGLGLGRVAAPIALIAVGLAFAGSAGTACSSSSKHNEFEPTATDSGVEGGNVFINGEAPCTGLDCKVVDCAKDGKDATTLTGKIYDPAGANPLYNVLVYIPSVDGKGNFTLPPIENQLEKTEPSCQTCEGVALSPLRSTITNDKGEFELKDVPVDANVPVVVQIGKWRRSLTIDITKSCSENKVPDRTFRLPKNGKEGDMPHVAVTTGACDALECLLRGIGIDDAEFVPGNSATGHMHVFNGEGGSFPGAPAAGGTTSNRFGGELWNDTKKLSQFDIVMMSCECDEYNDNKGGAVGQAGARAAMWEYANGGGKIFATHYHYTWFKNSPQGDFQSVAKWGGGAGFGSDGVHDVVQTLSADPSQAFPKGVALANWLLATGASSTLGKIPLVETRDSVSAVQGPSQAWIANSQLSGTQTVQVPCYFSFNTPIAAEAEAQCGRSVFSDIHVSGTTGTGGFPNSCPAPGGLSAQQKALEFMFFDLSSCVQSDSIPPVVPN